MEEAIKKYKERFLKLYPETEGEYLELILKAVFNRGAIEGLKIAINKTKI